MDLNYAPRYALGDRVRIWTIFGHPIGTVMEIIAEKGLPIKYRLNYLYENKAEYTEIFSESDVALYDKGSIGLNRCTCGVSSAPSGGKHSPYCRQAGQTEKGLVYEREKLKESE